MDARILSVTSRTATIELVSDYCYFLPFECEIFANGKSYGKINRNVFTIHNLEPDQEYILLLKKDEEKLADLTFRTEPESFVVDVRDFGAKGDGKTLDTFAVQAAIMSCPEGGTVVFPPGTYLLTPVFLKSNLTIEIQKDAVLLGVSERTLYPILPGLLSSKLGEIYLSSWEGEPAESFASLVTGIGVENVRIIGQGVIDANANFDDWWFNPKVKRIAWRPRSIFLNRCKNILIEGITIRNSPSWTVHPLFCKDLKLLTLNIVNPKNSPNTDGINPESCSNVLIAGCRISVGDDCVAVKAGKYEVKQKFDVPSENIEIRNCLMEHGHGAVVIGSEMSCGVRNVKVSNCLFVNTDRGLRIKTRRERGGYVDEIELKNVQMNGVFVPLAINCFYNCGADYDPLYSSDKVVADVNERTPTIGSIVMKNVLCEDVKSMAAFVYGLPEKKIEKIYMENVRIEISKECEVFNPEMFDGVQPVCRQGLLFKNVDKLVLKNVVVENQVGEKIMTINVDKLVEEG
ncbi:glycoside hydrolase family 28 protein [Pseudothermotoga thermarum]|uniref:Glycoside hydrolase family 28 n=1 Tax=Pseudothermotoga thermarum DSM 5069 TaxID=688269 RepID=F7YW05_9THEM|nr:glycoside hydrolase family 28 protein [Pseudothermotoga thermarum]AEH50492.1 glycoside hydrolase family 28 [Pseudothermotoga thermarum DSM 5069]